MLSTTEYDDKLLVEYDIKDNINKHVVLENIEINTVEHAYNIPINITEYGRDDTEGHWTASVDYMENADYYDYDVKKVHTSDNSKLSLFVRENNITNRDYNDEHL